MGLPSGGRRRLWRDPTRCGPEAFEITWSGVGMAPASWVLMAAENGYTLGMKTAVSVPNEVFERAERLAKRLKVSRSELYSRALREYLARHSPDEVRQALDALCADLDTGVDDFVGEAGRRVLEAADW